MRTQTATLALLISVAALLAGCGHDSGVDPRPVLVDEPSTYVGPWNYLCGAWNPSHPTVASATFDLHVSPGAVEKIREAGGTIVHEFNVPIVRAYLPVDAVPRLASTGHIWAALQVAPDSAFDFGGIIGIPTPLSGDDRNFLESAGVTIIQEFNHSDAIYALIPDASVPAIRSRPSVRGLEINSIACADGEARRGSPWSR